MSGCLFGLGLEETETVLRVALAQLHGAEARLESWSAQRFTTHGRHRVVRYDLCAHPSGASGVQRHQWVGKFYDRGEDARRAETILRALADIDSLADGGVVTPRVVACDPPRGLLLMTYEAGGSLITAIAQYPEVVPSAIGRALAALHATDIPLDEAPGPAALLADLQPKVTDLYATFPGEATALRSMLAALVREMPLSASPGAFLHGDFGPAQLIWQGGHIVVLDLDKCGHGDPAVDLGNLLTQLRRLTLLKPEKLPVAFPSLRAAILDAYQRWSPPDPGLDGRVAWHEQVALLRKIHYLAFDRTRHPEADAIKQREAEAFRLLACAHALLDEGAGPLAQGAGPRPIVPSKSPTSFIRRRSALELVLQALSTRPATTEELDQIRRLLDETNGGTE
jgi:aminoglycoside phosphotransferase (APT) family kinase protein